MKGNLKGERDGEMVYINKKKKNIIRGIGLMINRMDLVCIIKTEKKLKGFGSMEN